jgi:hypothetical protein
LAFGCWFERAAKVAKHLGRTNMSYLNKVAGVAVAASVALGGMATSVLAASIVSFNGPAGEAYVGPFH